MEYRPLYDSDTHLHEIFHSMEYFVPHKRTKFLQRREEKWMNHVDTLMRIKHGEEATVKEWGTERADFLALCLDVLDRKIGTLLQFQGLLGIATSILFANIQKLGPIDFSLKGTFIVFVAIWFITTFLCMRGVSRIYWGDLSKLDDLTVAEYEHMRTSIHAVIKRTARFRLASLFAFINGTLLFIIVLLIGWNALI